MSLIGHEKHVTGVAFLPDGKTLASCSEDQTVRVWDLATGKAKHVFKDLPEPALAIAASPDGKLVAAASSTAR